MGLLNQVAEVRHGLVTANAGGDLDKYPGNLTSCLPPLLVGFNLQRV